jgi:hypothetical protein
MPTSNALALLFLVLAAGAPGLCQNGKLNVEKDGQLEITPEMAERSKRQSERLPDPSFIKLKIELVSNCQAEGDLKFSKCYKAHRAIRMNLLMTNTSSESISIAVNQAYYPYHLRLFRDGELVPYRQDVADVADKPSAAIYRNILVKLEPGKTELVEMIELDNWYSPLEPGHYQLDLKRRFQLDGGWTAPASITFKVDAK